MANFTINYYKVHLKVFNLLQRKIFKMKVIRDGVLLFAKS